MIKDEKNTIKKDFSINEKFSFIEKLTNMIIKKEIPSLIITGDGGLGKTYTVISAIEKAGLGDDECVYIKGYSTARGLYNNMYDNNGKLFVFDDCDSILDDKVAINLLKSALDSYDKRTISWMAKMSRNDEYPQQFEFNGRIIFISNKRREKLNDALLSRSFFVDLSMTTDDKIERMENILPTILPTYKISVKKDALSFLKDVKDDTNTNLNLRSLIKVTKIINAFPNEWRDLATYSIAN